MPDASVLSLALRGSRDEIRRETVRQCLLLLLRELGEESALLQRYV
jgi:hypothetical protein